MKKKDLGKSQHKETIQSLSFIISEIENLFSILNVRFFDEKLPSAVITISPDTKRSTYGWCTSWKAWTNGTLSPSTEIIQEETTSSTLEGYYEINLCAEYIARPFEEIVETLLHEMVHLFNIQSGIQDTSRGGYYHNKEFKKAAEQHGLSVTKIEKYGYSETALSNEAQTFVQNLAQRKFELYRRKLKKTTKAKHNSRKYVCPKCGAIIRATKDVNVICDDCHVTFIKS